MSDCNHIGLPILWFCYKLSWMKETKWKEDVILIGVPQEWGGGGWGYEAAQLDEALRYKPESRGFDSRRGIMIRH